MNLQQIPPRAKIGYLDREIAGEGESVVLSDGEPVSFNAAPIKAAVPDQSGIKSIQRYFHRVGFTPFPCWIYHPTNDPKMVLDQTEASEYGVIYRKTSADERARYGREHMYDWRDDTEWRPTPFPKDVKFNPSKQYAGKNVIWPEKTGASMQDALIEKLIPQVAASVAAALKLSNPSAPASVDEKDWSAFQEFMAWKKAGEATREAVQDVVEDNALATDERTLWLTEAETRGVKVDKRWSTERIKSEVEAA
jgi:hypothetical protein